MTGGDSPLHPVCARTLDQGVEQESPRIEMLVDMHIQRQPALLGKLEQKIQKRKRVVGVLRDASDRIGTRSDCGCKPLPGGIKVARSVPRQVCHDLQGHALAAAFAQLDHGFDGAKAAVGFDIRMIADSHRPTSKAALEGALGTRDDIFARRCGGKPAIRRRGTFQRSCRIFDQAPRARLVEVLMRIHQPRYD